MRFSTRISGLILLLLLLYSNESFSQEKITYKKLPLLSICNPKFLPVLDSIITFSKTCEGKGLKFLTFYINIRAIDYSTSQVYITLVDCQGLDYILRLTNRRDSAAGYFTHQDQTFIVTGQIDNFELFETTKSIKEFNLITTGYLLKSEYSAWFYKYSTENGFQLDKFDQRCDSTRLYPICTDQKNNKTKR
jgi:hypothetical protein